MYPYVEESWFFFIFLFPRRPLIHVISLTSPPLRIRCRGLEKQKLVPARLGHADRYYFRLRVDWSHSPVSRNQGGIARDDHEMSYLLAERIDYMEMDLWKGIGRSKVASFHFNWLTVSRYRWKCRTFTCSSEGASHSFAC